MIFCKLSRGYRFQNFTISKCSGFVWEFLLLPPAVCARGGVWGGRSRLCRRSGLPSRCSGFSNSVIAIALVSMISRRLIIFLQDSSASSQPICRIARTLTSARTPDKASTRRMPVGSMRYCLIQHELFTLWWTVTDPDNNIDDIGGCISRIASTQQAVLSAYAMLDLRTMSWWAVVLILMSKWI